MSPDSTIIFLYLSGIGVWAILYFGSILCIEGMICADIGKDNFFHISTSRCAVVSQPCIHNIPIITPTLLMAFNPTAPSPLQKEPLKDPKCL